MRSWHDYHITGYSVDGPSQRITLFVSWPYKTETDIERASVIFSGVECYYFEYDLGTSIVLDLGEWPLQDFLAAWSDRFETECKWGWPRFWRPKPLARQTTAQATEEAFATLSQKKVRCFELSSSYGMSGWILATEVSHDAPLA
jgi:hypothetical protein